MHASFIERKLAAWLLRQTSGSGVRKVVSAFGAVASEIGSVRSDNQDKAVIVKSVDASGQTFVAALVADGIGGMRDGSRCAAIAIGSFVSQLVLSSKQGKAKPESWLEKSIDAANFAVHREYKGQGGSTLVAVLLHEEKGVHWTSAGDSRLYRFSENKLTQLSVDDTIAGQLGKKGPVPPEQSKILQYVGMGSEFAPHFESENWRERDQYILTTDGVHYLSESVEVFSRIIAHSDEIGLTTKRLIDLAKWCGGPDNATAAILYLPRDVSYMAEHDTDSLSVWDAFGELQVQVEPDDKVMARIEPSSSSSSEGSKFSDTSDNEFAVIEDASEENSDAQQPAQKPHKPQKRAPRKKKNPQADEDKVQLDIKFSSKSD